MPPPNLRTRSPHTTPRSLLWSSEPIQSPPRKDERTQPESRKLCCKARGPVAERALPGIVQPVSVGVAPGPLSLCTSAWAALSSDWLLPLGRRCTPLADRTFPRKGARFFLLTASCKEEALRLKQGEGRRGCWSRSHIWALSCLPTRLWSSLSPASEQELFPFTLITESIYPALLFQGARSAPPLCSLQAGPGGVRQISLLGTGDTDIGDGS